MCCIHINVYINDTDIWELNVWYSSKIEKIQAGTAGDWTDNDANPATSRKGGRVKEDGSVSAPFFSIFHGKKPVFVRQSLVSWAALCKTGLWGIGLDKATCFGSGSLIGFLRFSQLTSQRCLRHTLGSLGEVPQVWSYNHHEAW